MINFRDYAMHLKDKFQIDSITFFEDFTRFLVDNKWFGITPVWNDNELFVEPNDFDPYISAIEQFFNASDMDISDKTKSLISILAEKTPITSERLNMFYEQFTIPIGIQYYLTGFLAKFLSNETFLMNDLEIKALLKIAFEELIKQYGDILGFFLSWQKEHYKTNYRNDYTMAKRRELSNEAYDFDEYLQILYILFNEEYILENRMYYQAALSKNYVDTWLFLALHFICTLRNSDLIRIKHPRLTMSPEKVLEHVMNGTFPDEDARLTLYSITWRLSVLPLNPFKTHKHTGIPSIKFCVPESIEVHMGILFAVAEAHRLIQNIPDDESLIRIIPDYDRISRYMGDEIGAIFLESNFKTRAANKSYLQAVLMLTDDIIEDEDDFNTKGYILAALARSHKGSYGKFAATTAVYLKDAKFNGLTPEFVAMELFERGVLSFIPSMLLKMITNGEYNKLPIHKQTELIQELNLSPKEIEDIVVFTNRNQKKSTQIVKQLLQTSEGRTDYILDILHRIANGEAVSKQNECFCLLTAMKKICPYFDRTGCIGCDYEISTKSTVFLMMSEYNRLLSLYQQAENDRQRNKYKTLIKENILPTLDEILQCVQNQYGPDALLSLEKIIKETING